VYEYDATVESVYDGDTMTVMMDLGLEVHRRISLRLHGIDTPEIKTGSDESKKQAKVARDYVTQQCVGRRVRIKTIKDKTEKYGRYLAIVWLLDAKGQPVEESLNDALIRLGYAKAYDGGKKE
jgi:micrococcal nuclease